MKKLIFICLLVLNVGCSSAKSINDTNDKRLETTQKEVIQLNKLSRMATIGNIVGEKIQSVQLYDKKRNLIKNFENVKVSKFTLSVQGIYLINVVTDKGLHMKIIKE